MRFDDIRVLIQYPIGVRQRRSLLQDNMFETRPVVGTVTRSAIEIREPPQEGRPPSFSGAVGRFGFSVEAKPVDVAVGEKERLGRRTERRQEQHARERREDPCARRTTPKPFIVPAFAGCSASRPSTKEFRLHRLRPPDVDLFERVLSRFARH